MTTSGTRPVRRPAVRRPTAGTALAMGLLAVVIAGCGPATEQEGDSGASPAQGNTTQEPGPEPSPDPEEQPTGQPTGLPALVSASQGGGTTDMDPVVIESPADVEELAAGLEAGLPELVESRVREARSLVPEGQALVGMVVWVGCETPTEVRVEGTAQDPVLTAVVPGKGSTQCLVPVTTVALAAVPEG